MHSVPVPISVRCYSNGDVIVGRSEVALKARRRHRASSCTALVCSFCGDYVGVPDILAAPPEVLSPRMVQVIEGLADDWRGLDQRVDHLSSEITTLARQDAGCERLMSVPGIGPIISSAMVAAIGTGDVFSKGRDFAAWLGLVPKQISTGDCTILGKISKRGNRYLRVLFVQAAWVVLIKPQSWDRHGLKQWLDAAKKRLHRTPAIAMCE